MPCWPDLWNTLIEFRWLAWPLLFVLLAALLIWAPAIEWRWLRIALRFVGGAMAFCVVVVVFVAILINWGGAATERRKVISPNGSHIAMLTYRAGFLGRDSSRVEITKKGCCQHFTAYLYYGPSYLDGTSLVWLDDTHLEIGYKSDPARRQYCENRAADVAVICHPSR
jgi:hypothetical protein